MRKTGRVELLGAACCMWLRPLGADCPLWVKSGHVHCTSPCPLLPRKRTHAAQQRMFALGQ